MLFHGIDIRGVAACEPDVSQGYRGLGLGGGQQALPIRSGGECLEDVPDMCVGGIGFLGDQRPREATPDCSQRDREY
jgi:hypothetical protein